MSDDDNKILPIRLDANTVRMADMVVRRLNLEMPGASATRSSVLRSAVKLGLGAMLERYPQVEEHRDQ